MKDRIRHIMESQHMTQQVFAQFINIAGQALLYTGVNILHRAGLEKF